MTTPLSTMARAIDAIPVVRSTAERTLLFPTPATNQRVHNLGTGAIERWNGAAWVQDIGPIVVNVTSQGAVGDGVFDNATAIQAAVDIVATQGGIVFFPPGVFLIGTRINITGLHNVAFEGSGIGVTTLKASGSRTSLFSNFPEPNVATPWANPATVFDVSKLAWRHLTLDMDYDHVIDGGSITAQYGSLPYRYSADNYQYPIYVLYCDGITIEDCEFLHCWYNGIEIYGSNDVWVRKNHFRHVGDKQNYLGNYSCVEVDAYSHRVHIEDNDGVDVGYGWDINAAPPNASPDGIVGASDVYIEGNTLVNVTGVGVQVDGTVRRLFIRRNTMANLHTYGIVVSYNQAGMNNVLGVHVANVSDNTIDTYNTTGTSGVSAMDITAVDATIEGNTFVNAIPKDGTGALTHFGLLFRQLTETIATVATDAPGSVMIRGNQGRGAFNNASGVESTAKNTTLSGNRVVDAFGNCLAAFKARAAGSIEVHNEVAWTTIRGPRTTAVGTGRAAITALSANRTENTDITLTLGADARVQQFLSSVTNNITISIGLIGAGNGDTFKIVRRGLGAGTINVASVKTMPASTAAWCEVTYDPAATPLVSDDGSVGAWVLTGYGTL